MHIDNGRVPMEGGGLKHRPEISVSESGRRYGRDNCGEMNPTEFFHARASSMTAMVFDIASYFGTRAGVKNLEGVRS
jgi:hypothetical protein